MEQQLKKHFRKTFYFALLIHHLYVSKKSNEVPFRSSPDERVFEMESFRYRYVTGWNFAIQVIYLLLAIATTFFHLFPAAVQKYEKKMLEVKGYIFTTFMFPWTMFVCIMFWSQYHINKDLVLPEALELVLPTWMNHAVHTTIIIPIIVEVIATKQVLPSFKSAVIGLIVLLTLYTIIFFYTYYEFGRWIYAFFYFLSWQERAYCIVGNYVSSILFMKLGISMQNSNIGALSDSGRWRSSWLSQGDLTRDMLMGWFPVAFPIAHRSILDFLDYSTYPTQSGINN